MDEQISKDLYIAKGEGCGGIGVGYFRESMSEKNTNEEHPYTAMATMSKKELLDYWVGGMCERKNKD